MNNRRPGNHGACGPIGVLAAALVALPEVAAAQDGFDAHGFNLAALDGDVRSPLTVLRPGPYQRDDWFAGMVLEYAREPLVEVVIDADGNEVENRTVLDDLFVANTSVGWVILDRLRLDAALPLYLTSQGLEGAQGVDVGDARITAMLALLQPNGADGGFGLGLAPILDLPLGNPDEFLGMGTTSGGGKIAATYQTEHFTLGGDLGVFLSRQLASATTDAVLTGLAIGYNPSDDLGFTLEGHLDSPFRSREFAGTGAPSELLLSGRKSTDGGAHFLAGAAMAVSPGATAADYRIFVGGGFGHVQPQGPFDADLDGIFDPVDACVDQPETVNAFRDGDGCPDGPGRLVIVPTVNGQPVAGAKLQVEAAGGPVQEATTGDQPWSVESMPERAWRASATHGSCLAGEGQVVTREGETRLEIPLKPDLAAEIKVIVQDPKGKPITTSSIRFAPEPDGCVPADPTPTIAGMANVRFGPGGHELRVDAPGYRMHTEVIDVARGAMVERTITLQPTKIQLTEKAIVILDVVYFETNKAVIKPESFGLLDEVATTIRTNPQLGRVEIGGHTDSQGADAANLDLSQRRAAAVRDYLAGRGVEAATLLPKGYGESKPIDVNTSATGRAKNRRVEFNLLDRQPPPAGTTPPVPTP